MGIISSGVKALGRGAVKKTAAKKVAPKVAKKTAAEWNAEFAAIEGQAKRKAVVGGVVLGATPLALMGAAAYEMDAKAKERKVKEAVRSRLPKPADKFSWANR